MSKIKINEKTKTGETFYYSIEGEVARDDGKIIPVSGSLAVMWDENSASAEKDFTMLDGEKDITIEEAEEFEKMAIDHDWIITK